MIAKYNLTLDEDMIYLIETLKVEGYWSLKNYTLTLQNKDVPFLNHIEDLLKRKGLIVPSKRILLKIKLNDETNKEDVRILNENQELNFHIEKSPFDNKKVKAVISLPYKKAYQLKLVYKNKYNSIEIQCLDGQINYESKLKCFIYKELRFPKIELLKLLYEHCGDKKYFHVEKFLFNANKSLVMSAFSALVDCEGSINYYGLYRKMRIRMRNKNYLNQWKNLLLRHDIKSRLQKNNEKEFELCIEGWQDFNKLSELGFRLYHSRKSEKWKEMLSGFKRNQISRGSYKEFYINKLKEINKKVTSEELSKYLKKSKRVTNHYLLKLEKEKLIFCDRNIWPYRYFISTSSVR